MASTYSLYLIVYAILVSLVQLSTGQTTVNAGYWFPESGLAASDIDSTLFTHLFYAFANISETYQLTIPSQNAAQFSQFTSTVQATNPSVKTILSIGGGRSNPAVFAAMASQSTSRKSFIDSSLKLARSNNFVGLDLDWEYPQSATDMTNLGKLLTEWRSAIASEATSSGKPRLLLVAAVSFNPVVNGLNYPVQSIKQNLDWINVMAYDFYGPTWSKVTNAPAELYDPSGQGISGSDGVKAWIQAGLTAKQLALGIPFYGYAWELVDSNNHGLFAPGNGPDGGSGDGTIRFEDVRFFITENKAVTVYNATLVTNYCYADTTWIGYDDTQSVGAKVLYAKQKGLLGYFAWHIGADDEDFTLSNQG